MSWITLLSALVNLANRLLGRLDESENQQKQSERDQRRDDVSNKPIENFSDMFGKPSNEQLRSSTIEQQADKVVRADLPSVGMGKDGERPTHHS